MEEHYYADRVRLRQLLQRQEQMTTVELMAETGRSRSWVKKWRQRLREAPVHDEAVLHSQSRVPHRRRPAVAAEVVARILAIRDTPPGHLQRTPGPKTILYYLQQDTALCLQYEVPRAPSTIWRNSRQAWTHCAQSPACARAAGASGPHGTLAIGLQGHQHRQTRPGW